MLPFLLCVCDSFSSAAMGFHSYLLHVISVSLGPSEGCMWVTVHGFSWDLALVTASVCISHVRVLVGIFHTIDLSSPPLTLLFPILEIFCLDLGSVRGFWYLSGKGKINNWISFRFVSGFFSPRCVMTFFFFIIFTNTFVRSLLLHPLLFHPRNPRP